MSWWGLPGAERQCTGQTVRHALFVYFLPVFYIWSPAPVACKMPWQKTCSLWMGKEAWQSTLLKPSKEYQSPWIQSKKGSLGNINTEWRPAAENERRILAIVDLLARALLFFDGLYALELYVHNISPLNRIQVFINTNQGLLWSF